MSQIPFPPIGTPLTEQLYGKPIGQLSMLAEEPLRVGNPTAIPLFRQNALAMTNNDEKRFARMSLAWGKLKGEPYKRRVKKRTKKWKPRKAKRSKAKRKAKWIPRKQYLAKKRKYKK